MSIDRNERDEMILDAVAGRRANSHGWIRANCPMCPLVAGKQDRKSCLALNGESGIWHCFRCGSKGKLEEMPTDIATRAKKAMGDTTLPPKEMLLPEGFFPLWKEPGLSAESLADARSYLSDVRNVTPEVIASARIGACVKGKFAGRIVVPMFKNGNLAGYVGRVWTKKAERPYLYAEGMERASLLYNGETLQTETDEPAIVVEGVFDTFPFYPDGVAVLGKPSDDQFDEMKKAKRPIAIVMDGDAWREGRALCQELVRHGVRAGWVKLEPGLDPDECVEMVRKEARACVLG